MTNSWYRLRAIDHPIGSSKNWWEKHYPNACKIIMDNTLDVYVFHKDVLYLKDYSFFINLHKQGYSFVIDKNEYRYGLLAFDQNSIKEERICYFCITYDYNIDILGDDLKNQVLNYILLQ